MAETKEKGTDAKTTAKAKDAVSAAERKTSAPEPGEGPATADDAERPATLTDEDQGERTISVDGSENPGRQNIDLATATEDATIAANAERYEQRMSGMSETEIKAKEAQAAQKAARQADKK